jgi:hypothetical protein
MMLRAEVDEARLVRMQLEAEPTKPFPQRETRATTPKEES